MSNCLDPDQARHFLKNVGPDLVQTVCSGYQQMIKVATSSRETVKYTPIKSSADLSLKRTLIRLIKQKFRLVILKNLRAQCGD